MKKRFVKMMLVTTMLSLSLMLGGCGNKEELLPTATDIPVNGEVVVNDPLATPAPTAEPTEAPKVEVTEAPVIEATEAPKAEATEAPVATEIPEETKKPEVVATEAPVAEPTAAPKATAKPTEKPKATQAPTAKPTEVPKATQAPVATAVPATAAPTQAPTAAPTQAPVAHTHTWDSGTVIKNAECGNDGIKQYKCSCGETKNETIPATGSHSWYESYFQYPTCTQGGSSTKVCSICGVKGECTTYDYLPHDYESTLSWEGNCSSPATYKNVCKNCGWEGAKTYGEVNPNVHNWRTVTNEVWDNDTFQWVTVTGTKCFDCKLVKE